MSHERNGVRLWSDQHRDDGADDEQRRREDASDDHGMAAPASGCRNHREPHQHHTRAART